MEILNVVLNFVELMIKKYCMYCIFLETITNPSLNDIYYLTG